ncbi:MAG: hypothetical protein ABIW76_03755 [Fibrobacteria bacterium]
MLPETFTDIPLNNYSSGTCSPILDDGFLGIRIAVPESIVLDTEMVLPVCGSYRFPAAFWNRFESLRYEMAMVAVNAETHAPLICDLHYLDYVPEPRKFNEAEVGFAEKTVGGWFNADFLFYHREFPRKPARYHLFVLIGEEKSNVATVRIHKP